MLRCRLAGLAFFACLQFFVVERICASRFTGGYDYGRDFISDLGAVHCAPGACSPLPMLMNASFLLQGVLIGSGALLLMRPLRTDPWSRGALAALLVCAFGIAIVALAPEDVAPLPHYAGAALHLIASNLAMIFFGVAGRRPPLPRIVGRLCGALGLSGVAGSALHLHFGLGQGGMERLAAYPFLLALIAMGMALLHTGKLTSGSAPPVRLEYPAV